MESVNEYFIYTDGAYSAKLNQGGIGIVVRKGLDVILKYNKAFKNTTNNQMELLAVIYALLCVKKPIDRLYIYSDSQYVINCIDKWERKKNIKLWNLFDKVKSEVPCNDIQFVWVKGHSTNVYNNLADDLAVKASHEILFS